MLCACHFVLTITENYCSTQELITAPCLSPTTGNLRFLSITCCIPMTSSPPILQSQHYQSSSSYLAIFIKCTFRLIFPKITGYLTIYIYELSTRSTKKYQVCQYTCVIFILGLGLGLKSVHQPAMAPLNGTHVYNIYENVKYSSVSVKHLEICLQIVNIYFTVN